MILSWYMTKAYLTRFFALMFGLAIFLQMLDLLANADAVLEGGGNPLDVLSLYIILRIPSIIETVAPLAGLLGALTTLVVLANNSEIIAMRAAGRSVLSLVAGLVLVGFISSILLFIFSDQIVVSFNAKLEDWKSTGYKPGGQAVDGNEAWVIEDGTIIRVGNVLKNGNVLNDIRLFLQTDSYEVYNIVNIRLAIWESNGWKLFEVQNVKNSNTDFEYKKSWDTKLIPADFNKLANPPSELSYGELEHYVREVALGTRPSYYYDTWLQQKIAGPVVLALMPLLAAIAAFAQQRHGSAVIVVFYGICLGFFFIVTDNLLLAMGQFGTLPPILAAWLPLLLFAIIGLWILINLENNNSSSV
jgi:lipopolysaccharide export system permease protein